MWTQSRVVRSEAFPETKEPFVPYQLHQYLLHTHTHTHTHTERSYNYTAVPNSILHMYNTLCTVWSHSQNDSGDLRGIAGGDGKCGICLPTLLVICVMAPPIHLGAWSMLLIMHSL